MPGVNAAVENWGAFMMRVRGKPQSVPTYDYTSQVL